MANEDLIAKKDVLQLTGISYGQFYRWKRMGLIPERWFLRRSTFTGQETFLPRERILRRIKSILALKEDYSLEEIAQRLSLHEFDQQVDLHELDDSSSPSVAARGIYTAIHGACEPYTLHDIVCMAVTDRLLGERRLVRDQVVLGARVLHERLPDVSEPMQDLFVSVVSKFGMTTALVHGQPCLFDPDTEILATVEIGPVYEDVMAKAGSRKE